MVSRLFSRSKKSSTQQEPIPALTTPVQVEDDVFVFSPELIRPTDKDGKAIYPTLSGMHIVYTKKLR
jgi:hypothetical protein